MRLLYHADRAKASGNAEDEEGGTAAAPRPSRLRPSSILPAPAVNGRVASIDTIRDGSTWAEVLQQSGLPTPAFDASLPRVTLTWIYHSPFLDSTLLPGAGAWVGDGSGEGLITANL